jgi:nitrogen fixation/metabolism regulation signal transduction histidine kinase
VAAATSLVSAALLARTKVADALEGAEVLSLVLYDQASQVIRQHSMEELRVALATDEGLRSFADAIVGYSPTLLYLAISDVDGVVIFHSDAERQDAPLPPTTSLREFSERSALGQFWGIGRSQDALLYERPFSVEGDKPFGNFQVAVSALLVEKDLMAAVRINTVLATSVVLIAFVVSFYIGNRLLAPLVALRDQLARISVAEDQPSLDVRTEADVGRVAEFFDSLSKRLAADHRLDESGLSLHTLVTGLNDAVVVLAADRTILSLNESARRLLGSETTLPGQQLEELLAADHPLREVVDEALERGRAEAIKPVPVAETSETVNYMLSANRLSESDRTSGVIVTARDLRQLSRLASQLSYAQKLASLGRLTSGVAHQLRNPLNAMVMHLAILRKKIAANSSDSGRHVAVLEEELGRLDRVVKGFLDFSRPEDIELQRLDVEEVIQVAINRMRHLANEQAISMSFRSDPDLPPITANFQLLEQAFVNLITNSCEAMPDGGRIDVSASRSNGQVVLVIEDSGPGIPEELQEKIFDLYVTTKEGGSGVGLSLVYRIVQLHGGDVRIESEPGRGTRARITLKESTL